MFSDPINNEPIVRADEPAEFIHPVQNHRFILAIIRAERMTPTLWCGLRDALALPIIKDFTATATYAITVKSVDEVSIIAAWRVGHTPHSALLTIFCPQVAGLW